MGGVVRRQKAEGRRQKTGKLGRRGQSIVEYLIIAALIVAAVLVIAPKLKGTMNNLMASSEAKVFNAEVGLANENPEKPTP